MTGLVCLDDFKHRIDVATADIRLTGLSSLSFFKFFIICSFSYPENLTFPLLFVLFKLALGLCGPVLECRFLFLKGKMPACLNYLVKSILSRT